MFCKNCGKELVGTPELCMTCGAKPFAGMSFCHACGAQTNQLAEICIQCGARLKTNNDSTQAGSKSKSASILLAVFLGWWTWLYTYKKDNWKFWVGLVLGIIVIILSTAVPETSLVTWIMTVGIWIWAIVDTAAKSSQWYSNY